MDRIEYKVSNYMSGVLELKGANVTVTGRYIDADGKIVPGKARAYLTPGLKKQVDASARMSAEPIEPTETKKKEPKRDAPRRDRQT